MNWPSAPSDDMTPGEIQQVITLVDGAAQRREDERALRRREAAREKKRKEIYWDIDETTGRRWLSGRLRCRGLASHQSLSWLRVVIRSDRTPSWQWEVQSPDGESEVLGPPSDIAADGSDRRGVDTEGEFQAHVATISGRFIAQGYHFEASP